MDSLQGCFGASLARMSLILRARRTIDNPDGRPVQRQGAALGAAKLQGAVGREIRPSSALMARDHQRNEMEGNDKE